MKKFLVFLVVIVVGISLTMMALALLKEGSVLTYAESRVYYNYSANTTYLDKEITINSDVDGRQNKDTVTYRVEEGSKVAVVENNGAGPVKIIGAGQVAVTVVLTNARGKTQSFEKTVRVGDGTNLYPYFVYNEATLTNVAKAQGNYVPFTADSHYTQVDNIVLNSEFEQITETFNGSYNGNSFAIVNYSKATGESSAMFNKIGELGKVGYLNFENVNIVGSFAKASVVANENLGFIDMVSTAGTLTNTNANNSAITAAIVATNKIYLNSYSETLSLVATISRSTNKLNISASNGIVGGIAGFNEGKILACISGYNADTLKSADITLNGNSGFTVGGIVGENVAKRWAGQTDDKNAKFKPVVADSYVTSKIKVAAGLATDGNVGVVGGIIGRNTNLSNTETNNVFGNYYITDSLGSDISANKIYDRGIGNGFTTAITTKEEATAPVKTSTKYVAVGISSTMALDNVNGVMFNNDIVSSTKASGRDLRTWNKQVWTIGKDTDTTVMYPMLNYEFALNFASKDFAYVPQVFSNNNNLIYSVETYFSTLNKNQNTNSKVTYRIVDDIDFSGVQYSYARFASVFNNIEGNKVSSLVGIESDSYNPEQYFTGEKITIKNLIIDMTDTNTLDVDTMSSKANFGIFGEVSGNISNIIFENITIIANGDNKNVGILAGTISGGNISGVEIKNSKVTSASGENVGGLAGTILGGAFTNNKLDVVISVAAKGGAKLGGLAGVVKGNNIVVSGLSANLTITQTNTNVAASLAGIAATIDGAQISNVKLYGKNVNGGDLNGYSVYGISEKAVSSSFSMIETNFKVAAGTSGGISAVSAAVGGVGTLSGSMANIKLATGFKGSATAVGLVGTMNSGSRVEWAVVENNFLNSGDKYGKTINKPYVTFSGDERGYSVAKKDFCLIPYHNGRNWNNNVDATLHNVFYSTNTLDIKVHTVYADWGVVDEGSFFKTVGAIFTGPSASRLDYATNFNGGYATGRIDAGNGSMIAVGANSKNYNTAGFDTSIWSLSGIPTLR